MKEGRETAGQRGLVSKLGSTLSWPKLGVIVNVRCEILGGAAVYGQ